MRPFRAQGSLGPSRPWALPTAVLGRPLRGSFWHQYRQHPCVQQELWDTHSPLGTEGVCRLTDGVRGRWGYFRNSGLGWIDED